jgi:hypothetical protein
VVAQRFLAGCLPAPDFGYRLVEELQLVAGNCLSQIWFELAASDDPLTHLRPEHLGSAAPRPGPRQQLLAAVNADLRSLGFGSASIAGHRVLRIADIDRSRHGIGAYCRHFGERFRSLQVEFVDAG